MAKHGRDKAHGQKMVGSGGALPSAGPLQVADSLASTVSASAREMEQSLQCQTNHKKQKWVR